MAKDWHGTEIKIGDRVRHVYEPYSGRNTLEKGKGYHWHDFMGTASVVEVRDTVVLIKTAARGLSPVFLGGLIEVVSDDPGQYLIPLGGEYREPASNQ